MSTRMQLIFILFYGFLAMGFSGCRATLDSPSLHDMSYVTDGTKDGGGGKGVLCGNHLRTLDIYEAEEVHHLQLDEDFQGLDQNLKVYGARLSAYLSRTRVDPQDPRVQKAVFAEIKHSMTTEYEPIPDHTRLELTDDATLPKLLSSCSIVQIAARKGGTVHLDIDLWHRLDKLNQASLILHEQLYWYARNVMHSSTSDGTRHLIGMIFSKTTPPPMFEPLWSGTPIAWCIGGRAPDSPGYNMYAVSENRNGIDGLGVYFDVFASQYLLDRVSAFYPGVDVKRLMSTDFGTIQAEVIGSPLHRPTRLQLQYENWKPNDVMIVVAAGQSFAAGFTANGQHGIDFQAWTEGEAPNPISQGVCFSYPSSNNDIALVPRN